jgi:lipoprotein-releasing system ATP-binding protein
MGVTSVRGGARTRTPLIAVETVVKSFPVDGKEDRLMVLRGVSLAITAGEIVAIVGASGAGKSTLLHIIGTLDRPTSGVVRFDGVDVFSVNDDDLAHFRNNRIGFVFQFHHLLPEFTALENVAMPALIKGEQFLAVRERALGLLHDVGMDHRADAKPPKLSGGEQQRVAVARALMNAPAVVLADDPSGNLDSANAEMLHSLIWDLSRKRGQTFVVVTHNESLARRADRIVRLVDGVVQGA